VGFTRYLIGTGVLLVLALPAGAGIMVPEFSVSQDGIHFITVPVISSDKPVQRYFSPQGTPAPRFGTWQMSDEFALYFNRTDKTLCLLVVCGTEGKDSGSTAVEIAGLSGTPSTGVDFHARKLEFDPPAEKASFTLNSTRGISGLSLGNLGRGPFTIQFQVTSSQADAQLLLAVGAGHHDRHAQLLSLDADLPLVIESDPPAAHRYQFVDFNSPGDSPPVPEPASLSLLGFAGTTLLARPRRRR
jgi:hypothetical protein